MTRLYRFLALTALAVTLFDVSPLMAAEKKYVIGFPEDNMANDWRAAQMRGIQKLLANHPNITFKYADAGGNVSKNVQDIEDLVDAGANLLFLAPRHPAAVAPVVSSLRAKGVKIVLLTRKLNSEDYDTFVSPDDYQIARKAAKFLADHLGGKGRVLMLEGVVTASTAIKRKAGFLDGMKGHAGIEVISKVGDYSRAGAIKAVDRALDEGLKFDAIYAHNDAMAAGARIALSNAGIDPADVPTVGIDYLPEAREAIRKGEQLASFTYPICDKAGVAAALGLLNGKAVPRFIEVPSQIVTRANVDHVETVF